MRPKIVLVSTMAVLALTSCGQPVHDNKAVVDELVKEYKPGRDTSVAPAAKPMGRYQVVPLGNSALAIKVDTMTGQTWMLEKGNRWVTLADDFPANDPEGIRQFLPTEGK